MITTTKEINLAQLDSELGSYGLNMDSTEKEKTITSVDGSPITEDKLKSAIAAHKAIFETPTIIEKLANAGISLDELKAALGI